MPAHFPRNETLDSLSTLTSYVLHRLSRVKSGTAGRGHWFMVSTMGCRLMPAAVLDLTRDGRWNTYNVSVIKLYNVSFRRKCTRRGQPLKLPSPTKLARPGHFPPASQAGRLAGLVFYVYVFLWLLHKTSVVLLITFTTCLDWNSCLPWRWELRRGTWSRSQRTSCPNLCHWKTRVNDYVHCKKKVNGFPVLSRDVTYQTLFPKVLIVQIMNK